MPFIHSGLFYKKLFYKKLGSNSGKFKKPLRNLWGWDPQKFKKLEAWGLVDWIEIILISVKVSHGSSNEEKISWFNLKFTTTMQYIYCLNSQR